MIGVALLPLAMMQMATDSEHAEHMARELAVFYIEHDEYPSWTNDEWHWHDLLVARICLEDGVPPPMD